MADIELATNPEGDTLKIKLANSTLESLGIADFDVTGEFDLEAIDKAIEMVSEARSKYGAKSNALEHTIQDWKDLHFSGFTEDEIKLYKELHKRIRHNISAALK